MRTSGGGDGERKGKERGGGEGEERRRKSVSHQEKRLGRTGQVEWRRGAGKDGKGKGKRQAESPVKRGEDIEGGFSKERKGGKGREGETPAPGCSVAFEVKGNGGIAGAMGDMMALC